MRGDYSSGRGSDPTIEHMHPAFAESTHTAMERRCAIESSDAAVEGTGSGRYAGEITTMKSRASAVKRTSPMKRARIPANGAALTLGSEWGERKSRK
ncbi:MAG: hypothetical protein JO172_14715 [Hyphomicrobiales bacterium]|nr:hypothetical protein [Hyphomicrobiales bacterium]